MHQTRATVIFTVLLINQAYGNPVFFWSQDVADCNQPNPNDITSQNYQPNSYQNYQPSYQPPNYLQQPSSYQAPSYQSVSYSPSGYQGPSYQETLQAMLTDTLKALCDIIQSTMRASKQEIASLAKLFLRKTSDCSSSENSEEEDGQQMNDYISNSVEPQSVSQLPDSNSMVEPLSMTNTTAIKENNNNLSSNHKIPLKVDVNVTSTASSIEEEVMHSSNTTEQPNSGISNGVYTTSEKTFNSTTE